MLQRCSNPNAKNYSRYGGRGISVCAEWAASFERFLSDVGPCPSSDHSIDRIDNDGGYEPGNVRWATRVEQMRNTSRADLVTYQGRTQTLGQWAVETGIPRGTIWNRIRRGLPEDRWFAPSRVYGMGLGHR
jgi:hypothetical protein